MTKHDRVVDTVKIGCLMVPFRTSCGTVAKYCVIVNVRRASRRVKEIKNVRVYKDLGLVLL